MKIAEILRSLADELEKGQTGPSIYAPRPETWNPNEAELTPVGAELDDQSETSVMVPPLQQKIELLKKAVGEPNVYTDDQEADADAELSALRKNAGLMIAFDDDDTVLDN